MWCSVQAIAALKSLTSQREGKKIINISLFTQELTLIVEDQLLNRVNDIATLRFCCCSRWYISLLFSRGKQNERREKGKQTIKISNSSKPGVYNCRANIKSTKRVEKREETRNKKKQSGGGGGGGDGGGREVMPESFSERHPLNSILKRIFTRTDFVGKRKARGSQWCWLGQQSVIPCYFFGTGEDAQFLRIHSGLSFCPRGYRFLPMAFLQCIHYFMTVQPLCPTTQ